MSVHAESPIAVRIVDIARPLGPIQDVERYPKTRIFVLDAGTLLGSVDVTNAGAPISLTRLRDAIANGVAYAVMPGAPGRRRRRRPAACRAP